MTGTTTPERSSGYTIDQPRPAPSPLALSPRRPQPGQPQPRPSDVPALTSPGLSSPSPTSRAAAVRHGPTAPARTVLPIPRPTAHDGTAPPCPTCPPQPGPATSSDLPCPAVPHRLVRLPPRLAPGQARPTAPAASAQLVRHAMPRRRRPPRLACPTPLTPCPSAPTAHASSVQVVPTCHPGPSLLLPTSQAIPR